MLFRETLRDTRQTTDSGYNSEIQYIECPQSDPTCRKGGWGGLLPKRLQTLTAPERVRRDHLLTFPDKHTHTQLPVQWDPEVRLHAPPPGAVGAVNPFVKANVFLPAGAGLMLPGKPEATAEWFALTCNMEGGRR